MTLMDPANESTDPAADPDATVNDATAFALEAQLNACGLYVAWDRMARRPTLVAGHHTGVLVPLDIRTALRVPGTYTQFMNMLNGRAKS